MLQTLGLPYKDFGDLSKALYQRSLGLVPGYDVMPPEVRDARISMQRAIWNYCYAASDTAEKEAACRQVLPLNSVTELAVSAPKRCAESVEKTLGASLSYFPRPDAGEPALNANADAWARYETCLKGNDLFGFMRAETNRICGVRDIGPASDRDQFVCACRGRSPPEGANCSGAPPIPAPVVTIGGAGSRTETGSRKYLWPGPGRYSARNVDDGSGGCGSEPHACRAGVCYRPSDANA